MSGFNPTYRADSIHLYIGTWCTGRATADSTTLDECAFTRLPGATEPVSFSPADVGCPIAIVGAGPIDPLTPVTAGIQGSTFHTTIAVYVSPTEVTLTDAPPHRGRKHRQEYERARGYGHRRHAIIVQMDDQRNDRGERHAPRFRNG